MFMLLSVGRMNGVVTSPHADGLCDKRALGAVCGLNLVECACRLHWVAFKTKDAIALMWEVRVCS